MMRDYRFLISVALYCFFSGMCYAGNYFCLNEAGDQGVTFNWNYYGIGTGIDFYYYADIAKTAMKLSELINLSIDYHYTDTFEPGKLDGAYNIEKKNDSIILRTILQTARVKMQLPSGEIVPDEIAWKGLYSKKYEYVIKIHAIFHTLNEYIFDIAKEHLTIRSISKFPPSNVSRIRFLSHPNGKAYADKRLASAGKAEGEQIFADTMGSVSESDYPNCAKERAVKSFFRFLFL